MKRETMKMLLVQEGYGGSVNLEDIKNKVQLFLFKKSWIGNGTKGFSSFVTNHDISISLKKTDENGNSFCLAKLT